jgi:uncharacterized DUF497 family protein
LITLPSTAKAEDQHEFTLSDVPLCIDQEQGSNRNPGGPGLTASVHLREREDLREPYGETRFQSIGVFNGVLLFVVWVPRGGDDVPHVISARKAVKHEKQAWQGRYSGRD